MSQDKGPSVEMVSNKPSLFRRAMRRLWLLLPKSSLSFNLGKLLSRTIFRPYSTPFPLWVVFAGGIRMRLDLGTFVANDLYLLDDHYESVTLKLWRQLARESHWTLEVISERSP